MGLNVVLAITIIMFFSMSARATGVVDTRYLFVPVGFDDNDEIVAVADGYLASPCLKISSSVVKKDLVTKLITVDVQTKKEPGDCKWDFRVPFTTVLTLGSLPVGEYTVRTIDGKLQEKLKVTEAKSGSVDNSLYAPVDKAQVKVNSDGRFEAVVEGRFTDTCSTVGELVLSDSGKTLELLPLMRRERPDAHEGQCEPRETRFIAKKVLPELMPGRYLLHVRSLNGQSINDVFSNFWVATGR